MSDTITKQEIKDIIAEIGKSSKLSFENAIIKAIAPIQQSFSDALGEIKLLNQEVHKQGENITLLWTNHNNGVEEKRALAIEISEIRKDIIANEKDIDGLGKKICDSEQIYNSRNLRNSDEFKDFDDRCDDIEIKLSNIHAIYATVSVFFVVATTLAGFFLKGK